ncbi:nuclear transport factor 2 family protein [Kitasatospora sp. NPDC004240]
MTTHTDHTDISLLVSRHFRSLDERTFDLDRVRRFTTDDIRTVTPIGTTDGQEALLRHTEEALNRFARTQHIATDVITEVAPDRATATASWNAVMTHVHLDTTLEAHGADADPLFVVGATFHADLLRAPEGWLFRQVAIRPVWTTGRPPLLDGGPE